MEAEGISVQIGVSIGVALYPTNAYDADSLITRADEVMIGRKRRVRGVAAFTMANGTAAKFRVYIR